ncbi:MAG: DinB family protein [Saprospiraceae bacterium]
MTTTTLPEYWLRGSVEGIPLLLQPVAHALLQAREEIHTLMGDFDDAYLWVKPAGKASVGFHLQHLTGVLDRLFTYARGATLSLEQLQYLKSEGVSVETSASVLVERFNQQVERSLEQLKATNPESLLDFRGVGRQQLPSTVQGLLFHAAEHTMRHLGQLLMTAAVVGHLTDK